MNAFPVNFQCGSSPQESMYLEAASSEAMQT